MDQEGQIAAVAEAPRGTLSARVDDKGRLKLPVAVTQYLNSFGENRVFITSLDGLTALIYPLSVWRENERMLSEPGDDADIREDIAMVANHYGEDMEIDGQGRVVLPTTLRRELQLEKDDVHLTCFNGRIAVSGDQVYQARLAKAKTNSPDKTAALKKKGFR